MKKTRILLTAGVCTLTSAALNGQVITVNPLSAGDFFYDLTAAMHSDVSALFQSPGSLYDSFVFTYSPGFAAVNFVTDPDSTFDTPFVSLGTDLVFEPVNPNPDGYILKSDAFVGFVGNESTDDNEFGYDEFDLMTMASLSGYVTLYDYRYGPFGPDFPPAADELDIPDDAEVGIRFFHDNTGNLDLQEDEVRFKMYVATVPAGFGTENLWMFAIDDREDTLIDYDDGFFIFGADVVTPVPEPATIGLFGAAGLIGLLLVRRRFQRSSKLAA